MVWVWSGFFVGAFWGWEKSLTVTWPQARNQRSFRRLLKASGICKTNQREMLQLFWKVYWFFQKKQIYGIKPLYIILNIYIYMDSVCIYIYIWSIYIYIWLVSPSFLLDWLFVFVQTWGSICLATGHRFRTNMFFLGGGHHETAGCWTVESLGYRAKQYDKRTGPMHYVNLFQKTATKH